MNKTFLINREAIYKHYESRNFETTRQECSDVTGLSLETISKHLKRLEQDGMLKRRGGAYHMKALSKKTREEVYSFYKNCGFLATQKECADAIGVCVATVSNHLKALEKDGIIKKSNSKRLYSYSILDEEAI